MITRYQHEFIDAFLVKGQTWVTETKGDNMWQGRRNKTAAYEMTLTLRA